MRRRVRHGLRSMATRRSCGLCGRDSWRTWQNGVLTPLDASVEGEVFSIGASGDAVQFAVRRRNGVWIVNQDGSVAGALPHNVGPVMLIPGGVVYATRSEIVVGNTRLPLEGRDPVLADISELFASTHDGRGIFAADRSRARDAFSIARSRAMKAAWLIALLPFSAEAQLVIYAVNGTTETVASPTYNVGQAPLNTTLDTRFRIYNTGSTAVSVNVTLGGSGFVLNPVPFYSIPANSTTAQALNIVVHFTPTSTAAYSASLQVNSMAVILLGLGHGGTDADHGFGMHGWSAIRVRTGRGDDVDSLPVRAAEPESAGDDGGERRGERTGIHRALWNHDAVDVAGGGSRYRSR